MPVPPPRSPEPDLPLARAFEGPPPTGRRAERRRRARVSLSRDPSVIAGDALAFVFDHHGFYVRLADDLIDEVPWRRRVRHHGLCVCLDAASKSLDPAAYARLAQIPTRTALLRLGFPKFLADILTGSSAFEVKEILGALPAAHLWHSLRVTIPLVCRDFPVCPARMDVVDTFASPVLGRELERFVATLR